MAVALYPSGKGLPVEDIWGSNPHHSTSPDFSQQLA